MPDGTRPHYSQRWYCNSKREAMKLYNHWLAEWKTDETIADPRASFGIDRPSVGSLSATYLQYAAATYVKGGAVTSHVYKISTCLQHLAQTPLKTTDRRRRTARHDLPAVLQFGDLSIDSLTPPDLARFRDLSITQADGRPRARQTVNEWLQIIRTMYAWAVERGMVDSIVSISLKDVSLLRKNRTAATERKRVPPVHRSVVDETLPECNEVVRSMIEIVWHTAGMRPQDVCIMRAVDLDTSGDVWLYRPEAWKTDHLETDPADTYIIPIGPRAQQHIQPWIGTDLEAYLFIGEGGKPYTTETLRRAIHRACDRLHPPPDELQRRRIPADGHKKTKLESIKAWRERLGPDGWLELEAWRKAHRWNPNQLRHAKGTALRKQYGLETAQVGMGHKHMSTTEIYAQIELKRRVELAREAG